MMRTMTTVKQGRYFTITSRIIRRNVFAFRNFSTGEVGKGLAGVASLHQLEQTFHEKFSIPMKDSFVLPNSFLLSRPQFVKYFQDSFSHFFLSDLVFEKSGEKVHHHSITELLVPMVALTGLKMDILFLSQSETTHNSEEVVASHHSKDSEDGSQEPVLFNSSELAANICPEFLIQKNGLNLFIIKGMTFLENGNPMRFKSFYQLLAQMRSNLMNNYLENNKNKIIYGALTDSRHYIFVKMEFLDEISLKKEVAGKSSSSVTAGAVGKEKVKIHYSKWLPFFPTNEQADEPGSRITLSYLFYILSNISDQSLTIKEFCLHENLEKVSEKRKQEFLKGLKEMDEKEILLKEREDEIKKLKEELKRLKRE